MARPASQVIWLADTAFTKLCGSGDFEVPPRAMPRFVRQQAPRDTPDNPLQCYRVRLGLLSTVVF